MSIATISLLLTAALAISGPSMSQVFPLTSRSYYRVPATELLYSGVGKDGIPAIDMPHFVTAAQTTFGDEEMVVGVTAGGVSKAYPYSILTHHEIVNDVIDGTPIAVTLCPLCHTTPVYERRIDGRVTSFGVSGRLFHSCMVMYDRPTDTHWSQPWGIGIRGAYVNRELVKFPSTVTTLGKWRRRYQNTQVLSTATGFHRDYSVYPYGHYRESRHILRYPVNNQLLLQGLHPKTIVYYISQADHRTPFGRFSGHSVSVTRDDVRRLGIVRKPFGIGSHVIAKYDAQLDSVHFYEDLGGGIMGREIPGNSAYAFAYTSLFGKPVGA